MYFDIGEPGLPGHHGRKGEPGLPARFGPKGEKGQPGTDGFPGKIFQCSCVIDFVLLAYFSLFVINKTKTGFYEDFFRESYQDIWCKFFFRTDILIFLRPQHQGTESS